MSRVGALAVVLAACGRIDFEPFGDGRAVTDTGSPAIQYAGSFASVNGSATFTGTAHAAGNAIVLHIDCTTAMGSPGAGGIAGPVGWGWTPLGTIIGGTGEHWGTAFGAIAPDTSPATFTAVWTGSCEMGLDETADEFTNNDPAGGATTFEVVSNTWSASDCISGVTTTSANSTIWAAASSSGTLTGVGASYIKGGDDGAADWSEYRLATDPAGTVEGATLVSAFSAECVMSVVAIKAR